MALIQGLAPSTVGRFRSALLSGGLAALFILFAVACEEEAGKEPAATPEVPAAETPAADTPEAASDHVAPTIVTVYSSPTCGCCGQYERYLEANGFEVKSIKTEKLAGIKDSLGIPPDMRSCHTVIVNEYFDFVEGHVPVEAVWKLLQERPEIDGIALPGMPSGAPGMGGVKAAPFIIYSIVGGQVDEFMTL